MPATTITIAERRPRFLKTLCETGILYSKFDDPDFRNFLIEPMSSKSAKEYVKKYAKITLMSMAADVRRVGGGVTIVCDLGTVDKVHTLNVLAIHVRLKRAYMIASTDVTKEMASAEGLAKVLTAAVVRFDKYLAGSCPIYGIMTDSAPNILEAARIVRDGYLKDVGTLVFNCGCHVLNQVSIASSASLIRELDLTGVESYLLRIGVIDRICPTRWWSRLREFHRALTTKDRLNALLLYY